MGVNGERFEIKNRVNEERFKIFKNNCSKLVEKIYLTLTVFFTVSN